MSYESLKDVYANKTLGRQVPPLPRQQVVPANNELEPPSEPFQLNQVHELEWLASVKGVSFYTTEFAAKKGEGNGERKVAGLFYPQQKNETEKNYIHRLS